VATSESTEVVRGRRGVEVRITNRRMPDTIIVDDEMAFIRLPNAKREALIIRSPEVTGMLQAFYEEAWSTANPLCLHENWAQIKRVLGMLANGYKDDVAARHLGMSVRTYRRYVADLMRDLNAQSRFQVGVRAAQLGWMDLPDLPE
jgi:hypothetical protein